MSNEYEKLVLAHENAINFAQQYITENNKRQKFYIMQLTIFKTFLQSNTRVML